ncbi:YopX protein [compost metagenome]
MREIKFRGKCIDECQYKGNWLYGCGFANDFVDEKGNREVYMNTENGPYRVDPETVGQYTGLQDKNDKGIYEGDIVRQTYVAQSGHVYDGTDMTYTGHHIGKVVITARGVCLKNPLHYSDDTDETNTINSYKQVAGYRSEVIGNVWDNPDLLGG